jgi:hypothetical protein
MAAEANSGFSIGVRDIEHPKWRVKMPKKLHAKWMGIMSQDDQSKLKLGRQVDCRASPAAVHSKRPIHGFRSDRINRS